jgi:hypothetical protein
MKLCGNLINRVMERSSGAPKVGDGATLLHYSDRTAATVTRVSASGKTAWVREDKAIRTDTNGMSEEQSYRFEPDPSAPEQRVVRLKNGSWKVANGPRVRFGVRSKYHDFSF